MEFLMEFYMKKNKLKFLGIIALVAVIGFSLAACTTPPQPDQPPPPPPPPPAQPAPDQPPPPPPPPPAAATALILDGASNYTVKKGDMLVSIAKQFYNNGYYYPVIALANINKIQDPDKIEPDTQIIIPNLQRNLNDAGARAVVKQALIAAVPFEISRDRRDTADGIRKLADSMDK
jgi:hypothetical protein